MKTYLEPEELKKLEDTADNARDKMMVRLLIRLGCRVSELLGVSVEDVDLARRTIRIKHEKTKMGLKCPTCNTPLGKSHTFCPKCGVKVTKAIITTLEQGKMRTLPIDKDTTAMLAKYIKDGYPQKVADAKGKIRLVLFPITRYYAYLIVRKLSIKADLPCLTNVNTGKIKFVSPHRLRDSFAVRALQKDGSNAGLKHTQAHLGHANINTTMNYLKIAGDEEQKTWYDDLWEEEK
jgi:integrase/recombinase XerD